MSFNILETEWRFDDHNLFPQKTNIEVLGDNYTLNSNIENSDNTTIIYSDLKLENVSNKEMIFNFNQSNKSILEKEKSKKEIQKTEEEKRETQENLVDQSADFPGGMNNFRKKLSESMDVSKINFEGTIKTNITFTIDENGDLKNIEAVGNNQSFNNEAVRAVKSIRTKWIPAKKDGKAIESTLSTTLSLNSQ